MIGDDLWGWRRVDTLVRSAVVDEDGDEDGKADEETGACDAIAYPLHAVT